MQETPEGSFQSTCVQAMEHPLSTGFPDQPTTNLFNIAIAVSNLKHTTVTSCLSSLWQMPGERLQVIRKSVEVIEQWQASICLSIITAAQCSTHTRHLDMHVM